MGYGNGISGSSVAYPTQSLNTPAYPSKLDPPSESPSRIRNTICNIEQAVENLGNVIAVLEKRFDTVLAPPSPAGVSTTGQGTPISVSSDVNQRLQQVFDRLLSLGQWVSVLSDRAEV